MKICSICKLEKDLSLFGKDKSTKDNLTRSCKDCQKSYREKNSDHLSEYRKNNRESKLEYNKKYREENKEKIREYRKVYRRENIEYITQKDREYKKLNPDKFKKYREEYYEKNKDKYQDSYKNNKNEVLERQRLYQNERRRLDPLYKISKNIRTSIYQSLTKNGYSKKSKTYKIIGCTFLEFKNYIESKFEPWMNWENYGKYNGNPNFGWDIDHIKPISSAINEDELLALNHYTNLQPLCSYINRYVKSNNIYESVI